MLITIVNCELAESHFFYDYSLTCEYISKHFRELMNIKIHDFEIIFQDLFQNKYNPGNM